MASSVREYDNLTTMLMRCGYNRELILSFIRDLFRQEIYCSRHDEVRPKLVFLNLPYIDDVNSGLYSKI